MQRYNGFKLFFAIEMVVIYISRSVHDLVIKTPYRTTIVFNKICDNTVVALRYATDKTAQSTYFFSTHRFRLLVSSRVELQM